MNKMMVKALSERIERFDAQIKIMKCRLKAKETTLKVLLRISFKTCEYDQPRKTEFVVSREYLA